MYLPRSFFLAALFLILVSAVFAYQKLNDGCFKTLTRADLPKEAVLIKHAHPSEGGELDEYGQPKGEMEHYATPEALARGGPIYGVYGYSVVAVEYEIPESEIGVRPVGKDFPGWNLSKEFLGFKTPVPYDHFHVGIKQKEDDGHTGSYEKKYLIHYMLLPHEEELKIGLQCG